MMEMTHSRPDVAFFLPSLGGGGAERVMIDLANGAAAAGRRVDMVLVMRAGSFVDDVGSDVRVIDLGCRRSAFALLPLARYLSREKPRSLLSTIDHANVLAVLAARLGGRRVRVVVRQSRMPTNVVALTGHKTRFLRMLMRWAYRQADAVVAVSRGVADAVMQDLRVPRDRVHVIRSPVITGRLFEGARATIDHTWFAPAEPPVILGVGRLVEEKGFDVLLRAFARVREEMRCRLLLLGEGPLRSSLTEEAAALGVAADVELAGFVSNPFAFMARCRVFVLSSRTEGLPNVLIQALALGAPVVSTDCRSGPREVLEDGRLGRLVPVDDAAAMAEAIAETLRSPAPPPSQSWARAYEERDITREYLSVLAC